MKEISLDATDIRILQQLQQDAALTNVELASRVNLSPSPCLARVKVLESCGVIQRRVAMVNPAVVGLKVEAFVHIRLEQQNIGAVDRFVASVSRFDEVMDHFLMTGFDCVLRVMVASIDEFEGLVLDRIARLPNVASVRSEIVLKRLSQKTELPITQGCRISPVPSRASRHATPRVRMVG